MFKKVFEKIKSVYRGGLLHIFGSNVIAHMFSLLSSVLVIRFLPKDLYGNYVDANNLYSYLTVFIGLGLAGAIIQFCSENIDAEKKNGIYKYSFTRGMCFNVLLSAIIALLAFLKLFSGDNQVAKFLFLMTLYPFSTYLLNYFLSILRVEFKNKAFSTVNIINAATIFAGNLLFTYLWGIEGLIFSSYLSQCLSLTFAYFLLKRYKLFDFKVFKATPLQESRRKELKKYGIITSITNFTSNVLILIDVTCLGLVLSDPEILADYHVATVLPNACLFIPGSLVLYYYPNMVKSYSEGWASFKKYIFNIAKVFFGFAIVITLCIFIFAPLIIRIVYGEKYLSCVPTIRVLAINYFLCAFLKRLLGNVLAVLKRYTVNLIHTVIAGALNIVLNISLILALGSIGAAIATLCVTLLVVLMEILYLVNFDKKNRQLKED